MNTRTFTATAFAVALSTGLAMGEERSGTSAATQGQPGSQSSMSATQPGAAGSQSGMSSTQPGMAGAQSGMSATQPGAAGARGAMQSGAAGEQASAEFTDARSFLLQELAEAKLRNEIFEMAQNKAQSEAIKKLARNELQERRETREKLRELARELNIEEREDQAATVPGARLQQLQQLRDRLQADSGKEFDRTFSNEIAGLHQLDAARYQAAIDRAREERVKAWARENLPRIRQNLQAARQAYQEETGTAWSPGQQRFIPTARYEMRSGQQGASGPGASSQPSSPMGSRETHPGASSSGASAQPSSPMSSGETR